VADVVVRTAVPAELPAVRNVLDGAALRTDGVEQAVAAGDVLVAVADGGTGDAADDRILGALVLEGEEIRAVAVRRRRRDSGIGTALVEAAAARCDRLVARFDRGVCPFWESVGFAVTATGDGRFRGVRADD